MAMKFEIANESGFNALATSIQTGNATIKQDISNYLLGNLQHFRTNGKKVEVLQVAVDFLLTERFRDFDVIATAITFLTPVKFNMEAANGRKKWINIEGEAKTKDDAKEAQIKAKMEQNRARWSNSFERFAKGDDIMVANPAFFKGCNEGKAVHLQIEEKKAENFDQCIFALVDRLSAIRIETQLLADERNGASSDNTIALSLEVGKVKTSVDNMLKKVNNADTSITDDYISGASDKELETLNSYAVEMETVLEKMTAKLESLRGRISNVVDARATEKAASEEEEVLRKAAEIMAQRNAAVAVETTEA